ncbi:uncharacterized protein LOC143293713 isoform X2 [Babylonia areolata]|uniref:uncharacterized protein LOC143293713 isoform X2 n=1 Tax=Babylonia areolata TaxID=304850 RepID=UPI003FCFBE21
MKEMVGGCCVCSDERGWDENPLVYCDGHGCNVAVHQACYGIVTVPSGPWYCRKCESQERAARVRCELCPQKDGALKRTDTGGWCHVVCALYIPEACFGNVDTMEPIILKHVPHDKFTKVCYICDENKRDVTKNYTGACMQCNKTGCRQFFHVTCAQGQGLLCEESGNSGDNVKYCGYCSHHYKKLKKDVNIKTIPAFKPIPADNATPETTPEKGGNKVDKEKKVSKPAEQKVSSNGDTTITTTTTTATTTTTTSTNGTSSSKVVPPSSKPSKARPMFQYSLSTSSITSDSSQASMELQTLSDVEVKKTGGGDADSEDITQDSVLVPIGSSATVIVSTVATPAGVARSQVGLENLTAALNSQNGDSRPGQDTGYASSENLFAPLCNSSSSSHGTSSGVFRGVGLGSSNVVSSQSVYDSYYTGTGANSTAGALGLSGLLSSPLTSHTASSVLLEADATAPKRQRSKSQEVKGKEKKPRKPSSGEGKSKSVRGGHSAGGASGSGKGKKDGNQPVTVTGSALGHHNYASSVFGGGPCFQSPVPLTGFSSPDAEMMNGTTSFVPPPKVFPSLHKSDGCRGGLPSSMEEFLEQQWEQSAQFFMEQSKHFDVASLLNQMHHLKTENARLEEQVKALKSHRDHLLSTNARLAVPFASSSGSSSDSSVVEMSSYEKSQSLMELGSQSKSHHLSNVSIPPPPHLPVIEPISSPVETVNPLSVSVPLRMPDPLCLGQINSMVSTPTPPGQTVLYSMVPPPPHLQLPGFQQLVQTAGSKAADSKHRDKT